MIVVLAREMVASSIALIAILFLFLLSGIITPAEALSGLSNQGMITVALLFIIAAAIHNTGISYSIALFFLNRKKKAGMAISMLKMMVPASFLSAFLNNTPIVLMFTPIVKKWAKWLNFTPSKFLIPLSYATIFGGICTLVGTSTNLVVHGMMIDSGLDGFSMFELGKVGVPCAIIGWIYLAFIGNKLLPERKGILGVVREHKKEYVIGMKVTGKCPLIGKTIQDAGLRNLDNVYLIEIERRGKLFGPVSPKERIMDGDILCFAGITSGVVGLQEIPGLVPAAHKMFEGDMSPNIAHVVEAVISESSPLLGKTIKEADFRNRYNAGVLAVHRNGQRIKARIGDISLRAGDALLLLARDKFLRDWSDSIDFYLVSKVKEKEPRPFHKAYLAVGILIAMVSAVALRDMLPSIGGHKISMFYAASAAVALMIISRCLTIDQAKKSVKLNILLTIAAALGISKALYNSGAAGVIADSLINGVERFGPVGVLAGIYIITAVFTEVITNTAAAALIFPIAYSAALQLGINPKPFFIAIAIAASASFITPIGYQTNLIVKGPGGYRFNDYLKVGLPLSILFFIVSVVLIPLFWHF